MKIHVSKPFAEILWHCSQYYELESRGEIFLKVPSLRTRKLESFIYIIFRAKVCTTPIGWGRHFFGHRLSFVWPHLNTRHV